jgi:hypothetical protein
MDRLFGRPGCASIKSKDGRCCCAKCMLRVALLVKFAAAHVSGKQGSSHKHRC